jgi:uncharacterized protein (TIGR02466 family)
MIVQNLFPTPVGQFKLDREFTASEEAFLLWQETVKNSGNTNSANRYVLKDPALEDVNKFLQRCVDEYFHKIHSPRHEVKLRITQSWINYTKSGEFHHKHAHPNSFVSGVLYIKASKDTDRIYFYKDAYEPLKLTPLEWNIYNSNSWWLEASAGTLYLFPSSLTHMVMTKEGEGSRISLAFNTFPVGYLGEESDLTALYLGK